MINRLRPVYYEDKVKAPNNEKQPKHIGLIAEEVKEVIPEDVPVKDGECMSVLYDRLVPVLIDCIQQQNKKIESLENRLERLIRSINIKL